MRGSSLCREPDGWWGDPDSEDNIPGAVPGVQGLDRCFQGIIEHVSLEGWRSLGHLGVWHIHGAILHTSVCSQYHPTVTGSDSWWKETGRHSCLLPSERGASSRPEVNFTEVGGPELWFEQSTSFRLSTSLAPYYLQFALLLTLDFTLFCWCSDFSLPIQVEPPWRYPSPTRISINTCRRAAQCPKSCSFPQDLFEVQQNHSLETWDQKVRKCPVP